MAIVQKTLAIPFHSVSSPRDKPASEQHTFLHKVVCSALEEVGGGKRKLPHRAVRAEEGVS